MGDRSHIPLRVSSEPFLHRCPHASTYSSTPLRSPNLAIPLLCRVLCREPFATELSESCPASLTWQQVSNAAWAENLQSSHMQQIRIETAAAELVGSLDGRRSDYACGKDANTYPSSCITKKYKNIESVQIACWGQVFLVKGYCLCWMLDPPPPHVSPSPPLFHYPPLWLVFVGCKS